MRTGSYFKHGTGDQGQIQDLPRRTDHGEHRTRACNGGLAEQSPQSEPMLVKSGEGQNSLKLKAFCPFSYI